MVMNNFDETIHDRDNEISFTLCVVFKNEREAVGLADQGTGTTDFTSGRRSLRLFSMPCCRVMLEEGHPTHAP